MEELFIFNKLIYCMCAQHGENDVGVALWVEV